MKLRAVCLALIVPRLALAADVEQCLSAHVRGQEAALEGKLASAMAEYRICGASHCPKLVRQDCQRRLASAEAEAPTLKLEVSGAPAGAVEVSIDDGDPEPLSEAPRFVDPGTHRIRFILDDGRVAEETVVVQAGERDVRVVGRFVTETPAPPPVTPEEPGMSPAVYVFGGVAALGAIGFVAFGLSGNSKKSELESCKPSCRDESLYDDMHQSYVLADVSLAVGIAGAALATYFYLDGKKSQRVGIAPHGRGAVLEWDARF